MQDITFTPNASGREELHLTLGFSSGSRFPDANGTLCPVHNTVARTWQHWSFFEHACFLHCGVPRIQTPEGKVRTMPAPRARAGSGFTRLGVNETSTRKGHHYVTLGVDLDAGRVIHVTEG